MSKKVAVYLRVSTESQNTHLQRFEIDQFLGAKGYESVVYYEDKLSGTNSKRPGLQSMLSDARKKNFDILVCWKLDRLFRSLKDLISTLNELSELGIDFISVKDNIDMTTASGRLLAHLLGAIAQFEADLIKMRINSGIAAARRKGIRLGRPSTLPIDDMRILRNQGLSLNQIANKLKVSKSGVHKSLSMLRGREMSINTEIIEVQKQECTTLPSGQKSNVKCTTCEANVEAEECHDQDYLCHDRDLRVTKGKG